MSLRTTSAKHRLSYYAISGVIALILGTQAIVTVVDTGGRGWPMITYPMYSQPRYDGDRLDHDYVVSAVLADTTHVKIDRYETGMSRWVFNNNIVAPIIRKESLDKLTAVIIKYCNRYDDKVIALKVRDLGLSITRHGLMEGLPSIELGSIEVTCDRSTSK
jgi:hypothetical protein